MGFDVRNSADGSSFRYDFNEAQFNERDFKETSFTADTPIGTMKATQWFFDGIKMSYSESLLHQPAELDWKGDSEIVTMHFNLRGKVSMINEQMPKGFELANNQHNLFYGKEVHGKLKFDDLQLRSFLIQFSRQSFFNIARDGNDAIKLFAENVATRNAATFSAVNLNIDLPLHNCINAILNCTYADALKKMFFFSKAIELLVLQAESFNKYMNTRYTYVKDGYDKERIVFARDYLMKNIDNPPTLTDLSKVAGINEYKLKRGFKETFNQTVFEYLSDARLEMAKNALLERTKSVTEIAFGLGYSSLQHFSAAFKKKFGVSPNKVK